MTKLTKTNCNQTYHETIVKSPQKDTISSVTCFELKQWGRWVIFKVYWIDYLFFSVYGWYRPLERVHDPGQSKRSRRHTQTLESKWINAKLLISTTTIIRLHAIKINKNIEDMDGRCELRTEAVFWVTDFWLKDTEAQDMYVENE